MARVPIMAMSCVYGFRDGENTDSRMRIHMVNPLFANVDFAGFVEYLTYAKVNMQGAVAALSDSTPNYIGVTMREVENAAGTFGTGEAEQKGVFLFTDTNGLPLFRMTIPGIKATCLTGNKRDIDLANTAVAAFVTAMTSGAQPPQTANGYAVKAVQGGGAYKQTRKSHGGSKRRTG